MVEAKLSRGSASVDCECDPAGIAENRDCDVSGFPEFEHYRYRVRKTCYQPLAFDVLRREISCFRRPFAFSWLMHGTKGTPYEEGHMMVARGYHTLEGQQWVIAIDPMGPCDEDGTYLDFIELPKECDGDQVVIPYDKWIEQDGYYEHWHDFYALEERRPGELIEELCDG